MVENTFDSKIKCLQIDMGGEFKLIATYLKNEGLQVQYSCAHTHEQNRIAERKQNGIAERKHRVIVEIDLTLLALKCL